MEKKDEQGNHCEPGQGSMAPADAPRTGQNTMWMPNLSTYPSSRGSCLTPILLGQACTAPFFSHTGWLSIQDLKLLTVRQPPDIDLTIFKYYGHQHSLLCCHSTEYPRMPSSMPLRFGTDLRQLSIPKREGSTVAFINDAWTWTTSWMRRPITFLYRRFSEIF